MSRQGLGTPLQQPRVLVTRPGDAGRALADALNERGLCAMLVPLIRFEPPTDPAALQAALAGASRYDWIVFTSPRAVEAVVAHAATDAWQSVPCAAVGPGTAHALALHGVRAAALASEPQALAVVGELGDVRGRRLLLPLSQRASPELADALRALGASVDAVLAYRTLPRVPLQSELEGLGDGIEAVVLASPTAVEVYAGNVAPFLAGRERPRVVAIGPVTATSAVNAGLGPVQVAGGTGTDEIVAAVLQTVALEREASNDELW